MELDVIALFDECYLDLVRYLAHVWTRAEAEDLASAAFLVAHDRRATFDPTKASARAWIFGIAKNLAREWGRSERARLAAYARATSRRQPSQGDEFELVCARVDAESLAPRVARALATLAPSDYDVLTLYCWGELSYDEIASVLGIPKGTVKSRLNRARRRVRGNFEGVIAEDGNG